MKVFILNLLHMSDPSKESTIQVSNEANNRDSGNDARADGDDTEANSAKARPLTLPINAIRVNQSNFSISVSNLISSLSRSFLAILSSFYDACQAESSVAESHPEGWELQELNAGECTFDVVSILSPTPKDGSYAVQGLQGVFCVVSILSHPEGWELLHHPKP